MAYKQFVPLPNLNFQFNRVLANAPEGCREEELWEIAPRLHRFDGQEWHRQWAGLARRAQAEGRFLHAAHYHRMSEFFLPEASPHKDRSYRAFQECFNRSFSPDAFERHSVPYQGGELPAMVMRARPEKSVVLLHGGFDSFVEEFYLGSRVLPQRGHTVIAFEGPGQGWPLRQGLKMDHRWEKPVAAVLDHFGLARVGLVGISLGGYLALRAAAHEPRVARVAAFDVVWDALAAMAVKFSPSLQDLVLQGKEDEVNAFVARLRQGNDMVDWMMSHGMHITGGKSPYEYLARFARFNTRAVSGRITQDVLLMAGESDHFVPAEFYFEQKEALVNAASVSGLFYRAGQPGEHHCQVGSLDMAWGEIADWLDGLT